MAWPSRFRNGLVALAAAAAPALAGCGETFHPVEGVVRIDGRPLPNASVTFVPDGPGRPAAGATDADGRFALETGNTPGVLGGAYTAVVVQGHTGVAASEDESLPVVAAPVKGGVRVPPRYAKPDASGLKFTVPADKPGGYDMDLTGK